MQFSSKPPPMANQKYVYFAEVPEASKSLLAECYKEMFLSSFLLQQHASVAMEIH